MGCRHLTVVITGLLLAAGAATAQTQSGAGTGGTGGTAQSGARSGTNQNQQTQRSGTRQQDRTRDGRARGAEGGSGFFSGSDAFGTRSQGGSEIQGSGADLRQPGRGEPVLRPLDRNQPGVNQRGLIGSGDRDFDDDFVRNLTPRQRADLARRLGTFDDFDGDGQVNMSQDRFDRLNRQGELDGRSFGAFGDADTYGGTSADLALALERLELLEQRILEHNQELLRRLGQARQYNDERQVRALADILQEMLQQHNQVLSYMSELRVALAEQSGLPAAPAVTATGTRTYAAPERSDWEMERGRRGFDEDTQRFRSEDRFENRERWR